MPPRPDPVRLTDAHRAAQSRIAVDTARALVAAFRLLDPGRIDATVDRWLSVTVPIVGRQRAVSARLAANYLSTLRANWGVWSVDRTTGALVVGDLPVREGRRLAGLAARVERMMSTGPGQASVEALEAPDDDTPSRAR